MARRSRKKLAGRVAHRTAVKVYKSNKRKPKRVILKKYAAKVGKVKYKRLLRKRA